MKKMQCKVCGSTRIKQINDSLCECGVCGRQYSLEEARQLITEIAETLSPQQQAEKEAALQSAGQYMAAGDTESALQNYETVLKMEPENEEALQAAIQIFASDNARDENGEVNAPEDQPESQPGDENAPESQPGEPEDQPGDENAPEDQPEGQPGDENAPEETQGTEDGAGEGTGDGTKDGADADANNAKSGSEKAKKGKTKKTKEKGKTSKKTEKEEEKEKDHDTDHDRDLDIHRDRDIDIDRDRDIDIHRDIDIGKDKKVVVEKEKKVKEKGGKKAGRGKTAIIIIIVAAVCVIAGIIIGVAVSHSSSSAEEETTVLAEVGATEAEEETEAAVSEPSESSESDEGAATEDEETTAAIATTAGNAEGTTLPEGSVSGMSAAEFADYLQNEAGLDIFETGGEPEVSDEVTLYYYGANIHIEKSKSVKAHDSSVILYIYESNDTGNVILFRVYIEKNDLESGLDAINDTLIFPVAEAFSTYDLKTYKNEKGQEDYETFRTELNESYENSAFDGKAYNVADLTFVFEEQEDIAAITLCNMYDLATLYNN